MKIKQDTIKKEIPKKAIKKGILMSKIWINKNKTGDTTKQNKSTCTNIRNEGKFRWSWDKRHLWLMTTGATGNGKDNKQIHR